MRTSQQLILAWVGVALIVSTIRAQQLPGNPVAPPVATGELPLVAAPLPPVDPGFNLPCPADVFTCADGQRVGMTGPNCTFAPCAPPSFAVNPVACPLDMFMCAPGEWVGRSGPNCTFECPPPPAVNPCPLDAIQCATGEWVGRSGPSCAFAPCAFMDCSSPDAQAPHVGCSGEAYANKCAADAANDYCDESVRLQGRDAMLQACPSHCENIDTTLCDAAHTAADGSCTTGTTQEHSSDQDESISQVYESVQVRPHPPPPPPSLSLLTDN